MKISELSVRKPVSTVVGVLLITLFGLVSANVLPIQLKPTVDKPVIRIETVYPGAAPSEVEEQITDKLEEKINAVEGLNKLSSQSNDSHSSISMEFSWGVNRDARFLDVLQKVNQVKDFPEEADEPIISAVSSVDEEKIMWIMLTSDTLNVEEMSRWATKEIKDALERVDGVGSVQVFGKREREIAVILAPQRMVSRQVSVSDVRQAILRDNLNVRGGYIDEGKTRFHVRSIGKFKTAAAMEDLVITRNATGTVYLRDIAWIRPGNERITSVVRGNGLPMIAIGVARKHGANVVEVVDDLKKAIEKLNERFEKFPYGGGFADLKLTDVYRESDYIWESLGFLKQNLILGSVLASLVLLFFLKSFRATLIVSTVIPICFISIFLFLQLFDRSINIISLAGIAFALGMTVDNAIVVIENIYRHLEMGKPRRQAALDGTAEVWGAILASTLTTIAVFLPVLYIKEEAGLLFKDIALTISCSVAMSLLLSLTVIPMLSARFLRLPDQKHSQRSRRTISAVLAMLTFVPDIIGKALAWIFCKCSDVLSGKHFKDRGKVGLIAGFFLKITAVSAIVALSLIAGKRNIPSLEYLPSGNRNMLLVLFRTHPGVNVSKGSLIAKSMEDKILALRFDSRSENKDDPDDLVVDRMFSVVSSKFNVIGVILKEKYARMPVANLPMRLNPRNGKPFRSAMDFMAFKITGLTFGTPGTKYAVTVKTSLFRFGGKNFEVEIRGPDIIALNKYSLELEKQIKELAQRDGFKSVTREFELGLPEIQVKINRERAADLGIKTAEVANVVETFVAGRKAGTFRDGTDEIDIVVKGNEQSISNIDQLRRTQFYIPGTGSTVLGSVAKIEVGAGPTGIYHEERERSISLTVTLPEEKPLQEAVEQIKSEVIDNYANTLPPGYHIEITGSASDLERTKNAFMKTFWLSVIIIYLLMASLFESFFSPLIIMFTVPLAVVGSILAIKLYDVPLDMLTLLGFIILCGIVVNNAILVVHQQLNFERQGMAPQEAIRESVKSRLRPIFMSSITTIFGMLPMCWKGTPGSELYSGLGTAIVGGLLLSTLFTLVVIPVLLSSVCDVKRIWKRDGVLE